MWFRRKPPKVRAGRRRPPFSRLTVERLEERRVLAVDASDASVADGAGSIEFDRLAGNDVPAAPSAPTILDSATPNLYLNDAAIVEGNGGTTTATFTVSISVPSSTTVTVNYATADGTAHAGVDYTATSGTATIAIGGTTTTFTVAIDGNAAPENNKRFYVNLSGPTGAVLFKAEGVGTIVNDDPLGGNTAGLTVAGSTNYSSGGLTNVGEIILGNLGQTSQYGNSVADAKFRSLYDALYDPTTGYAYFTTAGGTNADPGLIIKVNFNGPAPVEVGWTQAGPSAGQGFFNLDSGVIDYSDPDPAKHYAYFGTTGSPGKIIKVRLNAGDAAPTTVGSMTVDAANNEGSIFGAVIDTADPDPANHFAYFAVNNSTGGQPARIVKIAVTPDDTFPSTARVTVLNLPSGEANLRRGVIDARDPNNHYAYFASFGATSPYVVKIKLGADFRRIGSAALASDESPIGSAVLDAADGYLYLGTYNVTQSTAKVVMVATGAGDAAPQRVGSVLLPAGQRELSTAVIDENAGYIYFGDDHTHPAKIYKLKLAAGGILPTEVGVLTLNTGTGGTAVYPPDGQNISSADAAIYGEIYLQSSVIDTVRGYAYFGTDTTPGQVVKLDVAQTGAIKGTKITIDRTAYVDDLRFYSHAATGNVRLAVYDDGRNLVWQSGVTANTVAEDWLVVPVAPAALTLAPGIYWLTWQVDTTADVPSFTTGVAGDGFTFAQTFGAFPSSLAAAQSTDERWSEYLSYSTTPPQPPTVVGVLVRGAAWQPAFVDYLAASQVGASSWGYRVSVGPGQLDTVPWNNVDQLSVQFDENAVVHSSDLQLIGGAPEAPSIAVFSYDSDSFVATWTFSAPLSPNKYLAHLNDTVFDAAGGGALDGEWTTGVSTVSGDGTAGGDFNFRFNVLPGDFDGSNAVTFGEIGLSRLNLGRTPSTSGYDYRQDYDGSGSITFGDVGQARSRLGLSMGTYDEPAVPAAGPQAAAEFAPQPTLAVAAEFVAPLAPLIDGPAEPIVGETDARRKAFGSTRATSDGPSGDEPSWVTAPSPDRLLAMPAVTTIGLAGAAPVARSPVGFVPGPDPVLERALAAWVPPTEANAIDAEEAFAISVALRWRRSAGTWFTVIR